MVYNRSSGLSPSLLACLLLARPFFLAPTTSKRLLRSLSLSWIETTVGEGQERMTLEKDDFLPCTPFWKKEVIMIITCVEYFMA